METEIVTEIESEIGTEIEMDTGDTGAKVEDEGDRHPIKEHGHRCGSRLVEFLSFNGQLQVKFLSQVRKILRQKL